MPLKTPPLDSNGVTPHDHDEILANDRVIRRVSIEWTVHDPKIGGKRWSTQAFRKSSGPNGGMSIDLKRQIEDAGLDVAAFVANPRWTGSVTLPVDELRAEGFQVGYDPLPTNLYHGEVWGQFTRSQQKKLLVLSQWLVPLPDVILN